MATKMRTRSPTFLIPISCKIFWSQSMRLSPLKLLAARCQRPSTLHTQSQGDVITSEDRLILAAFDTMQPRDHLLLIPSPGFVSSASYKSCPHIPTLDDALTEQPRVRPAPRRIPTWSGCCIQLHLVLLWPSPDAVGSHGRPSRNSGSWTSPAERSIEAWKPT
jgi:hypothetical protein